MPVSDRLPNRRMFLKAGALPVFAGALPRWSAAGESASPNPNASAKSVIYLFLSGGPSQLDMWDMKPDAPAEVRGEFNPVRTNAPGMMICEHMPRLARRAGKFALLRSLTHKYNLHSQGHAMMLAGINDVAPGFDPNAPTRHDWPSLAAVAGVLRPGKGVPGSAIVPHPLVHRTGRVLPGQFAGWMGPRHDPWVIGAAAHCTGYGACPDCFHFEGIATRHDRRDLFAPPADFALRAGVGADRFAGRMSLLDTIDAQRRDMESATAAEPLDEYRTQAVSILTSGRVRRAFDMNGEPDRLRDDYGRNQFGYSVMLARRLVEAGVGFVQVNLGNNETWDTHQGAFPILRDKLLPQFDQCVSALIDDLSARGLLDKTLIVACGEFGRTPKISTLPGAKQAGRDHWGAAQSVFLAGGGIKGGAVVGATDRIAGFPVSEPCTPADLAATVYAAAGFSPHAEVRDTLNRPIPINNGRVIASLLE